MSIDALVFPITQLTCASSDSDLSVRLFRISTFRLVLVSLLLHPAHYTRHLPLVPFILQEGGSTIIVDGSVALYHFYEHSGLGYAFHAPLINSSRPRAIYACSMCHTLP